jgi:hypothetical protein
MTLTDASEALDGIWRRQVRWGVSVSGWWSQRSPLESIGSVVADRFALLRLVEDLSEARAATGAERDALARRCAVRFEETQAARTALGLYGHHLDDCNVWGLHLRRPDGRYPCDCGLDAALVAWPAVSPEPQP